MRSFFAKQLFFVDHRGPFLVGPTHQDGERSRVFFSSYRLTYAVRIIEHGHKRSDTDTKMPVDPRTDKLIRRTAMVGSATAAYFLLASDYAPNPNALDPIKKAIESARFSVKSFVFGSDKDAREDEKENSKFTNNTKKHNSSAE
uniref:Uncharacterized protein n=1 Tax=Puya raimondii TaxID=112807 RepID=A0A8A0WHV8_PUYRA|nr:hypothetical protein PY_020537 [Puya raimondii]